MQQLFFEGFRLVPSEGTLLRGDERLHLTPKAFELLCFMAQHPQRLLSTAELLDSVWPGVHVGEAVLKVNVRQLRRALGDRARDSRFIETVHRRGYRFLPAVHGQGLPLPLTRCIGREDELQALPGELERSRLVTLTGAGGSGKTRLALELASGAAGRFADGVYWVELAGLADGTLVAAEVARCAGVREQPDRSLLATLVQALGPRRALLVLDNCEHLVEACAELVQSLLGRCPELRILATSREVIGVPGETARAVPPLAVPGQEGSTPEALERLSSVQLFVERVRSLAPGFELDGTTAAPLGQLCSGLDGMPLALELVAAQVPRLGLATLAERLRGDALLGLPESRSADARHRTIEATFDWSYRLLDEDEQRLLRQLSVFAGGFSLEAAEALAAESGPLPGEVAQGISRLVSRSLVETSPASGPMRYRLLEPIRQPARRLLESRAETAGVRERHAAFFLAEAERAAPYLESGQREAWVARLDRERENLRAALEWLEPPGGGSLVGLASALWWYWFHLGRWSEARRWLERAVVASEPLGPDVASLALYHLGLLDFFTGRYGRAATLLERAAAAAERAGIPRRQGLALGFQAMTRLAQGAVDEAVSLSEQGLSLCERSGDDWALALTLVNVGNSLRASGDLARSRSAYERSAALVTEPRDSWALAMVMRNLGIVDALEGSPRGAAEWFRRSLRELRAGSDRWFVSRGLEELGAVLAHQGEHERAARLLGAAEALREKIGAPVVSFYREGYDEAVEALRSALPADRLRQAWSAGRALGLDEAVEEAVGETT